MAQSEEEMVRFDVEYLLGCLNKDRGKSYRIVGRPDVEQRQSPQPDYLIKDSKTGNLIAVEHARFFESEKARKSQVSWRKRINAGSGVGFRWLRFPTPEELGKRLSAFVDEKLSKGQFAQFAHVERILLARNRWPGVRIHRFLEAEPSFRPQRHTDCDHFYLIVERRLVELF